MFLSLRFIQILLFCEVRKWEAKAANVDVQAARTFVSFMGYRTCDRNVLSPVQTVWSDADCSEQSEISSLWAGFARLDLPNWKFVTGKLIYWSSKQLTNGRVCFVLVANHLYLVLLNDKYQSKIKSKFVDSFYRYTFLQMCHKFVLH